MTWSPWLDVLAVAVVLLALIAALWWCVRVARRRTVTPAAASDLYAVWSLMFLPAGAKEEKCIGHYTGHMSDAIVACQVKIAEHVMTTGEMVMGDYRVVPLLVEEKAS